RTRIDHETRAMHVAGLRACSGIGHKQPIVEPIVVERAGTALSFGGEPAVLAVGHRHGVLVFDRDRDRLLRGGPQAKARAAVADQRRAKRQRAGERGRHCGGMSWLAPTRTVLRARTSTSLSATSASVTSGLALSMRMRAGIIGGGKRNRMSSAEGLRHRVKMAILPPPMNPARRNMITRCSGLFQASGVMGSPRSSNQAMSLTPGAITWRPCRKRPERSTG